MENSFKVTSIDDAQLPNNEEQQESNVQEQAQGETQEQAQVQEVTQSEPVQETVQEPVVEATPAPEEVSFETSSVEFDKEPEVEAATVEHDVPNKVDLRAFIEENNDLITQYGAVNKDYTTVSNVEAIESHLKDAHPSLSQGDIDVLLEDYSYDEESDDKAMVVKKKIAIEKAAKEARNYLVEKRDRFLQDLGTRQLGGPSAQEVEAAEQAEAAKNVFINGTDEVFSGETKSFGFKMSDTKQLDIKINNVGAVKSQQSDINNFIGKYFDLKNGQPTDLEGYHKAMFVAMNYEQMLQNAYQQGSTDAVKTEAMAAKNIDMNARSTHETPKAKTSWKLVD